MAAGLGGAPEGPDGVRAACAHAVCNHAVSQALPRAMTSAKALRIGDFEIMVLYGLSADFNASHGFADDLLFGFIARRKDVEAAERNCA